MSGGNSQEMTIFNHLQDLRKVLIICIVAIITASVCVYALAMDSLLRLLMSPIDKLGLQPVIIGVTEGFIVRMKVAFFGGLSLAIPVIIWQVLRFIFPALYPNEKKITLSLVASGALLFAGGVFFSFYFILNLALKVMLFDFAGGLSPMISMSKYISFIMMILFPFGLIFEIPLIAIILTRIGIISPAFMKKHRKVVIFSSFIAAAFLTPPDIFSQVLLAVPMVVLYEMGIIISSLVAGPKKAEKPVDAATSE